MSPLTKLFVVLLVFLSLLLSAASVTFLTTVPNLKQDLAEIDAARDVAVAQAASASSALSNAKAISEGRIAALNARITDSESQMQQLQDALNAARAEASEVRGQLALEQATVASTGQALQLVTQNVEGLQQRVADLREQNQQVTVRFADTQTALSQTQNELRFAVQSLRNEQEKNAELSVRNDQMRQALAGLGLDESGIATAAATVNGVITSRVTLPSGPHATISVGTQDDVRTGMEFAIYEAGNGDFLGLLVVTDVDDQQAFGRLRGDGLTRINENDLVRPASLR